MNGPIEPEGEVLAALQKWAVPFEVNDYTEVDWCAERINEDLDEAQDAINKGHDSSAMNNLEEAVLYCGFMIAYAMGYKTHGASVRGFHTKVINFLVAYVKRYRPELLMYANRFQGIRVARNRLKYPDSNVVSLPKAQLQLHFNAADHFWEKFRQVPVQHLSARLSRKSNS